MKDVYTLFRTSLAGLRVLVLMTLVVGLAYPLVITGIVQVALPWQADGSLVTRTGAHTTDREQAVGSALVGQRTDGEGLFHNRPSAAGDGYDMLSTSGSNLGPSDPGLVTAIAALRTEIARREGVSESDVPPDAVTASASGLDPHISPEYADLQVARVASAQGLSEETVRRLVAKHTDGRTLGVLGEAHVNVLALNVAVLAAAGGA